MATDLQLHDEHQYQQLMQSLYSLLGQDGTALHALTYYHGEWFDSYSGAKESRTALAQGLFNVFKDLEGENAVPDCRQCFTRFKQASVSHTLVCDITGLRSVTNVSLLMLLSQAVESCLLSLWSTCVAALLFEQQQACCLGCMLVSHVITGQMPVHTITKLHRLKTTSGQQTQFQQ